jgi:hypothetical protein
MRRATTWLAYPKAARSYLEQKYGQPWEADQLGTDPSTISTSVQELSRLLHNNPWDNTTAPQDGTTSSPTAQEETATSQPEPASPTDSAAPDTGTPHTVDYSRPDLESLTVPNLRALAKSNGLTGYSKMKKAELVDALDYLEEE